MGELLAMTSGGSDIPPEVIFWGIAAIAAVVAIAAIRSIWKK